MRKKKRGDISQRKRTATTIFLTLVAILGVVTVIGHPFGPQIVVDADELSAQGTYCETTAGGIGWARSTVGLKLHFLPLPPHYQIDKSEVTSSLPSGFSADDVISSSRIRWTVRIKTSHGSIVSQRTCNLY